MISDGEWTPQGIDTLEAAAWDALKAGHASVAAGPGSGKSEFLAQKAGFLFETARCPHPQQILAISFKRSAASNLRERVKNRLPDFHTRFTSMTFDAFTKMIVDRFASLLPAEWAMGGTYRIGYSSRKEIDGFLDDVAASAPTHLQEGIYGLSANDFISKHVGSTPLGEAPDTAETYAVHAWWTHQYVGRTLPTLDFIMLNRLADLIIRTSPQLRAALAVTYPYVFVDEFQDTTFAQYSFLHAVFAGTDTRVTVVGDRNQRIMGWAGALDDAFEQFESDFGAESFALTSNYRSSPELVDLQHRFAQILTPGASKQASQVLSATGDAAAQVWSFRTRTAEAEKIAEWVSKDLADSGRQASDYAILARQKVADMEQRFQGAFAELGLRVRNDDAVVGELRLQDLLSDDLTKLFTDTIRLASSVGGQPEAWIRVTTALNAIRLADAMETWEDRLSSYLSDLRAWFAETETLLPAESGAADLVTALRVRFTRFISVDDLGNGRHFGENPDEIDTKLNAIDARLSMVLEHAEGWSDVVDAFREDDAVPLMTIHRSKGLEYHTVFIVGLDDDQWWAHAYNSIESTMTFFVGVSRAAGRIIFTHTTRGVARRKIKSLYEELEAAGVPFIEMD